MTNPSSVDCEKTFRADAADVFPSALHDTVTKWGCNCTRHLFFKHCLSLYPLWILHVLSPYVSITNVKYFRWRMVISSVNVTLLNHITKENSATGSDIETITQSRRQREILHGNVHSLRSLLLLLERRAWQSLPLPTESMPTIRSPFALVLCPPTFSSTPYILRTIYWG